MSDVIFEENPSMVRYNTSTEDSSARITNVVIKLGLAQSKKGAQLVLLGFVAGMILVSVVIFFLNLQKNPPDNPYVEGQNVLLPAQGLRK